MKFRAAILLLALAPAACTGPAAAQQDRVYELTAINDRPLPVRDDGVETLGGLMLLRADGSYALRVTLRTGPTIGARHVVGTSRRVDGMNLLVPDSTSPTDLVLRILADSGSVLRGRAVGVFAGDEEFTFRRLGSAPWVDGTYEATHWEGIPLPAQPRRYPIAEYTSRTLVLEDGRYRSELRLRFENGSADAVRGTGTFRIEGDRIVLHPDRPPPDGRAVRMHWRRGPDGTLRLIHENGETWDYRIGDGP